MTSTKETKFKKKSVFLEYIEALLVAIVLALFIRAFIFEAYKVPTGSMLETIQIGDHLIVNKFIYGIKIPFTDKYIFDGSEPKIGDIVVFKYPVDPSINYIKRVVGLPGDKLEIRDKQLYRNGEAIKEDYIQHSEPNRIIPIRDNMSEIVVPEGKYFMMGDNRDNSQDSRYWQFVDRTAFKGKAWRIYWSSNGLDDIKWSRITKLLK